MTCHEARPLLAEFAHEGDPAVEAHLRECAACAREAASLRETLALARSARPRPAFPGLAGAVRAGLDRPSPEPRAHTTGIPGILLVLAALVSLVLLTARKPDERPAPAIPGPRATERLPVKKATKGPESAAPPASSNSSDELTKLPPLESAVFARSRDDSRAWPEEPGSFSASFRDDGLASLDEKALERAIAWLPEGK